MKNEEKIEELLGENLQGESLYNCLKEMAEWKDTKFTEEKQAFIDKALRAFCFYCPSFECNECTCCFGVCDEYVKFNKLLNEEIK